MRRQNLMNEKVIKAITMGLVAFMALQSPMTVLAENGGSSDPVTQQTGGENSATQQQTVPEIEAVKDAEKTADNKDEKEPGAAQLIDTAQEKVETAEPTPQTPVPTADNPTPTKPADPADTLKTELSTAGDKVDSAKSQLNTAATAMQDGVNANNAVEQSAENLIADIGKDYVTIQVPKVDEDGNPVYVQKVDENGNPKTDENGNPVYVQAVDENGNPKVDEDGNPVYQQATEDKVIVGGYDAAEIQASSDANAAVSEAATANNNNSSESVARQAKANAESKLADADKELAQAKQAVIDADKKLAAVQGEYTKLLTKKQEAEQKLQNAQTALSNAVTYSGQAVTEMGNAEAEVARLQGELQQAYNNMKNAKLDAIQAQVDLINNIIEESQKDGKSYKDYPYWEGCLKLCNLIIENYILDREGITNIAIGGDFKVDLITDWEPDGDPAPRLGKGNKTLQEDGTYVDEDGNLVNEDGYITDKDGNVLLYQSYKYVTGTFEEKASYGGWVRSNNNNDNRVQVTYQKIEKDENGEETVKEVKEFYNYKYNPDGSIRIFQRFYSIDDNGNIVVEAQEAVAAVEAKDEVKYQAPQPEQPAVPSSWKTGEGEDAKVFQQTETTHLVSIETGEELDKPGEGGSGFRAIDTTSTPIETLDPDNLEPASVPDGNKTTTTSFTEKEGVERTVQYTYEAPYDVILGYEQKVQPTPKTYTDTSELATGIAALRNEGYEVEIVCHRWLLPDVKKTSTDLGDDIIAFIHNLLTAGKYTSFTLSATNTVDDKDKPITETREGIREIVTGYFTETVVEEGTIHEQYGDHHAAGDGMDKTTARFNELKKFYEDQGYTVTGKTDFFHGNFLQDDYSWFDLTYTKTATRDVEKTLSNKLYAADTFTTYDSGKPYKPAQPEVLYQPAVEAKDAIPGNDAYRAQKVVWETDGDSERKARENGTIVDSKDYLGALAAYQAKRSELNAKLQKYNEAKTAVENAADKVEELRDQIAKLGNVEYNNQKLIELTTLLENATKALSDAREREAELEKNVEAARAAVNSINLSRFNQVPRDDDDDDNGDNPGTEPGAGDEGGTPGTGGAGGSTPGTPAAPAAPAGGRVAAADGAGAPAAGPAAGNRGVLGARNGRGAGNAAADNGDGEISIIGDDDPALAGSIEDATGKKADKADDEIKKDDNVKIEDADPALASFNDVNEESHDWLWWILALLAGAVTIEEFTRRQLNKKKADQVSSTKADK